MAAIKENKVYQDFTDGLNDRVSPIILKESEATVLNNAVVNDRGILEKIKGYMKDHSPFPASSDSFIRFLLNLKIGSSVDVLLMAAQDNGNTNALYKVDFKKTSGDGTSTYIGHTTGTASFVSGNVNVSGAGTTWLTQLKAGDKIKATAHADSAYTEISSVTNDTNLVLVSGYAGATAAAAPYIARIIWSKNNVPRGIVFNNKAVITNGSETPFTYNNTSVVLITDPDAPKARYVEVHKQRVFMANTPSNPSRIFWSAVNDEQSWDPAAQEDIFPQDNGTIVSINSFADSLIVFKNSGSTNAIYQVVGNFDQTAVGSPTYIRKVETTQNIGIISERSPVIHNGNLYFISETGLYVMDQRLIVQKVTFNIDNFIKSLNFSLGPQQSKTYTFDTTAQWNTGTFAGTRGTSDKLAAIFDLLTITDARVYRGCSAVCIDSSRNVHIAYVSSSDNTKLRYKKWLVSDLSVSVDETVTTAASAIDCLSMDLRADGTPGIFYKTGTISGIYAFTERLSGTWITPQQVVTWNDNFNGPDNAAISFRYRTDNEPRAMWGFNTSAGTSGGPGWTYYGRAGGVTWSQKSSFSPGPIETKWSCSLYMVDDDHPRAALIGIKDNAIGQSIEFLTPGAGSDVLSTIGEELAITTSASTAGCSIQKNSGGEFVSVYTDSGMLKKRNHTTTTTTTLDANPTSFFGGYVYYSANDYASLIVESSGSTLERYLYETSGILQNDTTLGVATKITPGDRGMHNINETFVSALFGASANNLVIRRLAFRSIWLSPENSDATLSAWGTYDVAGEIDNGATVTQEIALNTVSPPTVFNSITPGALISSDPTKVFIKNRITFVLGTFAAPEIGSIVDNYIGAGVDAKQIVGISFFNELYYAGTVTGGTANNKVLIDDKFGSFLNTDYPISAFERFKSKLYAGLSTKGDLLILLQGYNFDHVAYNLDAQLKEDFLDSVEVDKDIYKIYVLFETKASGSFVFSYRLDNFKTNGGVAWTDTTIDQTANGIAEIPVGQAARSIQFRVQNNNLDNQLGLFSFVIVYGKLNIR